MTIERFQKKSSCAKINDYNNLALRGLLYQQKKRGKFIQSLAKVDSYLKCIYTNSLDFQRRTKLHKNADSID